MAGKHEGHWRLHHIALPGGPGYFTQYEAPEYVEEEVSPFGELAEHLAEVLGLDHAQVIAERGMEAPVSPRNQAGSGRCLARRFRFDVAFSDATGH